MRKKKNRKKWLISIATFAMAFIGLGVGRYALNTQAASAAISAETMEYRLNGTTLLEGSYTSDSPVELYMYGSSTSSGTGMMYSGDITNWSRYNIYVHAYEDNVNHVQFTLYQDGQNFATNSLGGNDNEYMDLYNGTLPDGEYELVYVCYQQKNVFGIKEYYEFRYYFTVKKTPPTYTLTAGGSVIGDGQYTNRQIVYTASDAYFSKIYYKRPNESSFISYASPSFAVAEAEANNGLWSFYAMDQLGNKSVETSVYLDTVAPVGTVTSKDGGTLPNRTYTNKPFCYTATDVTGITTLQCKAPGALDWESYVAGTYVSEAGIYSFRAIDKAGNVSEEYQIAYDATPPVGSVLDGTNTAIPNRGYTNADRIEYVPQDVGGTGVTSCYVRTPNSSNYTEYVRGTQLTTEGRYAFYCEDKAGNVSETIDVILDKTKPTGVLYADGVAVSSGEKTSATEIYFRPRDTHGVANMYVKLPNASQYSTYTSGTKYTEEGEYSFYAVDKAGNESEIYTVAMDRSIPSAQLFVGDVAVGNHTYTNGEYIKFVSNETCYVKLPNSDEFMAYISGTEFYKAGKYTFYAENEAGTTSGEYILVIDRKEKPLTVLNVTNNKTDGDVTMDWTDGDPDEFAPVTEVTVNGKPYTKGETIYTIDTGVYKVIGVDAAGNVWETEFTSRKQNVFTKTLQKEYFEAHDENGDYYSFASYDSAFAFAVARERLFVRTAEWTSSAWDTGIAMDAKDSTNAKNGQYFIYKKEGGDTSEVAYFTEERLNEVIAEYARAGITDYFYWEKQLAMAAEGENLYAYSDGKVILANSVLLGEDIACTLNGEVLVGSIIEVEGQHRLIIYDNWDNACEYTLWIVRNVPDIEYAVGEGNKNVVTFDRVYHLRDEVTISIVDAYDEMAMFRVYAENGELLGDFGVADTYKLTESGRYTVEAINHAGVSKTFELVISRNAPSVQIAEKTDGKKLEIVITKSTDKESHLQTLEIYKSTVDGEWVLLETDDYGREISLHRLTYAFRMTGKYKVVLTDEFRTGIDAVVGEIDYMQPMPSGVLTGVENGGYTNGTVKFEWTDEAVVELKKDGIVVEYASGKKLSADGAYVLSFKNYDGYEKRYTFVIDTVAPEVTLQGAEHGRSVTVDVSANFVLEGVTAVLFKDGVSLGAYLPTTLLTENGNYTLIVTDKANNTTQVSFVIDKVVDFNINVNENGLANSVTVTANENVAVQVIKDGVETEYALGDTFTSPAKYTLTLTDELGNEATVTFTIVEPLVQEFVYNFDDTPNFERVLVNGEDKRLNYGTLEVFEDGNYEIGVVVGGKTYSFTVTVDNTAPVLTLNGVENGGQTKEGVTLLDLSEKATMKVYLDDTEIEYNLGDELKKIGQYKVVLEDDCGNVAEYEFEILYKMNGGTIALIVIGVLAILGIIFAIILGKKATYKKKQKEEIEEEDEEEFEDESDEEQSQNDGDENP